MHIETVHIHVGTPSPFAAALLAAITSGARADASTSATTPAGEPTTRAITPPAINDYWPGQGGTYAGLTRGDDGASYHLILADEDPGEKLAWQSALDWATTVRADGHSDFTVPTRNESALLYANVRERFDATAWYWTSTQYSADYAYTQTFNDGTQIDDGKGYEAQVRAVRRLKA